MDCVDEYCTSTTDPDDTNAAAFHTHGYLSRRIKSVCSSSYNGNGWAVGNPQYAGDSDVHIIGFTYKGGATAVAANAVSVSYGVSNVQLQGCIITSYVGGLRLIGPADNVRIDACTIVNDGVGASAVHLYASSALYPSNIYFSNCTIRSGTTNPAIGIYANVVQDLTIVGCNISANVPIFGFEATACRNLRIAGNSLTVVNNPAYAVGISTSGTYPPTGVYDVLDNYVSGTTSTSALRLAAATNLRVAGNRCPDSTTKVSLAGATTVAQIIAAGGVVAGNLTTIDSPSSVSSHTLTGTTATTRLYYVATDSTNRWGLGANNVTEGGANAGSDFVVNAYADNGTFIDNPIYISRPSTGSIQLTRATLYAGNSTLAADQQLIFRAATGRNRGLTWQTGSSDRWRLRVNSVAEGGTSDGSNLELVAYTNTGVLVDTPLSIVRAAGGAITLARPVSITGASLAIGNKTILPGALNSAGIFRSNSTASYWAFESSTPATLGYVGFAAASDFQVLDSAAAAMFRVTSTLVTSYADTDTVCTFGRVKLGQATSTDRAYFAHFDHFTNTNYALVQLATGATVVNAASGQSIALAVNAVTVASVSSTGVTVTGNSDSILPVLQATNSNAGTAAASRFNVLNDANNGLSVISYGSANSSTVYGVAAANLVTIGTGGTTPSGLAITTGTNIPILFVQNNTERMRVTSAGVTITGTTTLSTGLTGLLKATAGVVSTATAGTDYLTTNQTITLSGDITGSGTTAITTAIATGVIVNTDINASAAIDWTKINKSGSSLADLTTRSATDLTSGTLDLARLGTGRVWDHTVYKDNVLDTGWNKLATIVLGTGLYVGVSFKIEVIDCANNIGSAVVYPRISEYHVTAVRSGGAQDDQDNGAVWGSDTDYIRLEKVSTGNYEIHCRHPAAYRKTLFRVLHLVQNSLGSGGSLTWNPGTAAGTGTGTLYTATTSRVTNSLHLVTVATGVNAINGTTFSNGWLLVGNSTSGWAMDGTSLYASNGASASTIGTLSTGNLVLAPGGITTTAKRVEITIADAGTNTAPDTFIVGHNTSGTPAANFGTMIRQRAESTTTVDREQTAIHSLWVDATDASRKAQMKLWAYDTTAREFLRGEASGTAAMIGFLGANAVVRPSSTTDLRQALIDLGLYTTGGATPLNLNGGALSAAAGTFTGLVSTPASTTGSAGVRLPHGTAPTSPVNGDVWTTTAGMYAQVNGVTVGPFGSGGSGVYGTVSLGTGVSTVSVTHSAMSASIPPLVSLTIPAGSDVISVLGIYNRTTTGFDVVLSCATDKAGYALNWAVPFSATTDVTTSESIAYAIVFG
jgi:hypothetical protein